MMSSTFFRGFKMCIRDSLDTADDRLYTIPGSPPNLLHEKPAMPLHPATALR